LSSQRGLRGHFKRQLPLPKGVFLLFSPKIPHGYSSWVPKAWSDGFR